MFFTYFKGNNKRTHTKITTHPTNPGKGWHILAMGATHRGSWVYRDILFNFCL
jgi:hypothetical protein